MKEFLNFVRTIKEAKSKGSTTLIGLVRVYRIEDNGDIIVQVLDNGYLGSFVKDDFDYRPNKKGETYLMYATSTGIRFERTTIEIDCDPFYRNQEKIFAAICRDIFDCEYYAPISTCFGNWTWKVNYKSLAQRDVVEKFLRAAYGNGMCRYTSW